MKRLNVFWLLGVAVLLTSSCAHAPRTSKDPRALSSIRTQYLADHPDGKFNKLIIKGEIAKGMNVLEVLAAWGLPARRELDNGFEHWTYKQRDAYNNDSIKYELHFERRVLSEWDVTRVVASSGRVQESIAIQQRSPELLTLPGSLMRATKPQR